MNNLLITTQIEDCSNNLNDYNVFYLGHWCLNDPFSELPNNSHVIKYHWDDRDKFSSDHQYLENVYENVLKFLALKLNLIHQKEYDLRYWRTVIGPWLFTYIPMIYDRWEMLKKAFQIEENYCFFDVKFENQFIFKNFNEFLEKSIEDEWNYSVFNRIIIDNYQNKTTLIGQKKSIGIVKQKRHFFLKYNFFKIINNVLQVFAFTNKIFFYKSYFPFFRFIKLNLLKYQVPVFEYSYFNFTLPTLNPSLHRKKIECPSEFCKDDFQILLFNYLLLDMPSSYLENYSFIDDKLNKLRINPKIIFTANAYWYDDSFNIWSSKRVFYGQSKLYLSQHGGALPPRYVNFNHEGKIADKNITWFKAINQNEIQLPPNKLSFSKINYIKNTKCVIIGYEYSRYSRRIESAAISSQSLTVFNNVCLFIECLNSDFIDSFYYKPYPSQGWGIKSQIQKKFPKLKVVENKLNDILCNSRIVICTYPQTTFSESIALDIPTILLFQDQLFELVPEASDLVKKLISSKIIFENPEDAANHIQNIWDDVDSWWQSDLLKQTKKLIYHEMILNNGNDWYKSWLTQFEI